MASTGLFRTKSIEQSMQDTEEPEHALKKSLSALDLTVFGVGVIIGTGIFVLTGKVAKENAGPAVSLAFVVAGVVCALAALCYAEFASTVPVAGSAYTFSYASLGELPAWIIGWDLVLEFALGAAVVAVGWSGYVRSLLDNAGWHLPESLGGRDGAHGFGFDILAAALVLVLTGILVLGMKLSARVTTVVVAIKVAVVLLVIVAGAFFIKSSQLLAVHPPGAAADRGQRPQGPAHPADVRLRPRQLRRDGHLHRGRGRLLRLHRLRRRGHRRRGGQEPPARPAARHPGSSLAICTVLYVAVSLVVTGMQKYTDLSENAPLADAFNATGAPLAQPASSASAPPWV